MVFKGGADKEKVKFENAFESKKLLSVLVGFLGLVPGLANSPLAWAREDIIPGSRYTSAEGAAMGDAFLPIGEDGPAGLFYNPAVLGKIRDTQVDVGDFGMSMNGPYVGNMGWNFFNVFSLPAYLPSLQANPGQYQSVGASMVPTFAMKNFAVGVLGQTTVGAVYNSNGQVTYRTQYQLIPSIGTGVRLAQGLVKLGYSLQWVNEAVGSQTVSAASASGYNQNLAQGSGFSSTLGAMLTFPMQALPTFSFVARNFLNTVYTPYSLIGFTPNPTGTPATEPTSLDASFSIQPKLGRGVLMNMVFEWRDMTNVSNVVFLGHMAMGAELNVRQTFFLRGGWGSGYPSAGFGLRRRTSDLSLAWYSEELGTSYLSIRDIRWLLQYRIRAF